MKRFGNPLLSIAAPLLIVVALSGMIYREGSDRLQSVPALFVGFGLIFSGAVSRRHRRQKLLAALKKNNDQDI